MAARRSLLQTPLIVEPAMLAPLPTYMEAGNTSEVFLWVGVDIHEGMEFVPIVDGAIAFACK